MRPINMLERVELAILAAAGGYLAIHVVIAIIRAAAR